MSGRDAEVPFIGYRVYGPVIHAKQNRRMVFLVKIGDSKKRTSMSYARYLMSVHCGRVLNKDEHVDHIDDNKLNDVIDNFQLLTPEQNSIKRNLLSGRKMVRLKCPECEIEFVKERGQSHLVIKSKKMDFCSRICASTYWSTAGATMVNDNLVGEFVEYR